MKKILFKLLLVASVLTLSSDYVYAQTATSTATTTENVLLNIKNGSEIIFEGEIEINESTTTIKDSTETEHVIVKNTVLAVLNESDILDESFFISDLQYYESYDSFFINCIDTASTSLCYNWQYVVNNTYPSLGVDDYVLSSGDEIYLYFGQPRRLVVPENATTTIEFSVQADEYDYINDMWSALEGYSVGVFLDDPDNPWTPNVIATSSLDDLGKAYFTIDEEGAYKVGLEEDYYWPFYEINIASSTESGTTTSTTTSTSTSTTTTPTDTNTNSGNGGGSGSSSNNDQSEEFDIDKAIDFLLSKQEKDGSFGADLYDDWTAIAFSSAGESNQELKNYIKDDSVGNNLYDILRRSMALLSQNIDPQEDYKENLIEKIIEEFDGEQIGEKEFVNDDIFALIVLENVGYDLDDDVISKTIEFILSEQSGSGAWVGVDITAAAIQALKEYDDYSEVSDAINKAENYLEGKQDADGGWGDAYSTSWSMMAMRSLGLSFSSWQDDPMIFLGKQQAEDGGLLESDSDSNRIWSTSYAIAAASGDTWSEILKNFKKNDLNISDDEESKKSSSSSNNSESDDEEDDEEDDENDEGIDEEILIDDQPEQVQETNNSDFSFSNSENEIVFQENNQVENNDADLSNKTEENFDPIQENPLETTKDTNKNLSQKASVVESGFEINWMYFVLGLIALLISVIMFKRK